MAQNSKGTKGYKMKINQCPIPVSCPHELPFSEASIITSFFGVFPEIFYAYKNKYLDCLSPNNVTVAKHYIW